MTMPAAINTTGANNANMNRILNAITRLTQAEKASPDQGRNHRAAPGHGSRRQLAPGGGIVVIVNRLSSRKARSRLCPRTPVRNARDRPHFITWFALAEHGNGLAV